MYTNPVKALSEFKPRQYDLILLDVRMPYMNGFRLYEKLKKIDKSCRVCFVTAFESYYQSLKEFFPNLDIKCVIRKPITEQRLLEHVVRELQS